MLAARGVSLGLGKINLSDLNTLPADRHLQAAIQARKKEEEKRRKKPKVIIKKKADAKTVWAACRAVIFGCIVISVGLGMTALGYFDKHFSMYTEHINGTEIERIDRVIAYQLKSLQYIGPILMGIGTFVLIIACVITLESRDKHTQVIHEESQEIRRRRQQSIDDDREQLIIDGGNHCIEQQSEIHTVSKRDSRRESGLSKCSTGTATSGSPLFARVPRRLSQGPAPLAEVDESLNNSIQSINEQHIPQSG